MSDFMENTRIINAENQEHLTEARDAEIRKVERLIFLLGLLKDTNVRSVDTAEKEGIQNAIKILTFQNYLRLDDSASVLNLHEFKKVSLTYTERKAIRNYLIRRVPDACDPIVKFARKIKTEFPEVYGLVNKNKQILELEMKRRNLLSHLAEVKNKKCLMLKAAADLKMGPYWKYELQLMLAEHRLNQMKTSVFKGYILNTLFSFQYSRTDQTVTVKAIKEAEGYVDAAIETVE